VLFRVGAADQYDEYKKPHADEDAGQAETGVNSEVCGFQNNIRHSSLGIKASWLHDIQQRTFFKNDSSTREESMWVQ